MKILSRPVHFILHGILGLDFFPNSDLLYPNMKFRLRLFKTKPNIYMISDNPNLNLEFVDCSLYTGRIALGENYQKNQMNMLAYTPVEINYVETLATVLIIPGRQNQFLQENFFNNAPFRWIAIAMNTNSTFTGSYTEIPIRYQQIDLRHFRILKGGQPIVDVDVADKCRCFVTTLKAVIFQDDIISFPIDNFRDHFELVFDLTSM